MTANQLEWMNSKYGPGVLELTDADADFFLARFQALGIYVGDNPQTKEQASANGVSSTEGGLTTSANKDNSQSESNKCH